MYYTAVVAANVHCTPFVDFRYSPPCAGFHPLVIPLADVPPPSTGVHPLVTPLAEVPPLCAVHPLVIPLADVLSPCSRFHPPVIPLAEVPPPYARAHPQFTTLAGSSLSIRRVPFTSHTTGRSSPSMCRDSSTGDPTGIGFPLHVQGIIH
jgi:hypothetical protein